MLDWKLVYIFWGEVLALNLIVKNSEWRRDFWPTVCLLGIGVWLLFRWRRIFPPVQKNINNKGSHSPEQEAILRLLRSDPDIIWEKQYIAGVLKSSDHYQADDSRLDQDLEYLIAQGLISAQADLSGKDSASIGYQIIRPLESG